MEKRVIAVTVICLLLFLAACESKTTGKRVAIPESSSPKSTGVFTAETKAPAATGETGKTAAEALKELQATGSVSVPVSGAKSGTFYPPVTSGATEKEALKERTRALMTKGSAVPSSLTKGTLGEFGARYHDSDGDSTNLPEGYEDSSGD